MQLDSWKMVDVTFTVPHALNRRGITSLIPSKKANSRMTLMKCSSMNSQKMSKNHLVRW